jgi:alpha-L-fucosidase
MKQFTLLFVFMFSGFQLHAHYSGGGEANPELVTNKASLEKFKDMRLGLFIHWEPVSLRGEEISWSLPK